MGGVFVEIGADPKKFFAALSRVNKGLANMGKQLVSGGTRMAAAGVGMAAPIVAAVRQGAAFESTLLNIRASTGATAGELDRIKAAAMGMSQALGVGPTAAAQGMLELLKAGMSLDSVLGGAGRTALEFAKVGEMDVAQAAVVMSDAMNVFGVSGSKAANTLSAAADASSTSIQQMAEAFSMSSAVAGLANQSIDDLSAALAILANAGVKGSDAGTSVKTMLMRLMAPADDAAQALAQIGLSVASFRGADGKMLPMVEIIGKLNAAMGGLDQAAKDDIFRRIFGADAIRAASILSAAGVDGFQGMLDSMSQALPVGEKYKILMSGLAGQFGVVVAALQRMAIAISDAVGPALASLVPYLTGLANGLAKFIGENKEVAVGFAEMALAAVGIGAALTGVGLALQVVSFGFGGLVQAAKLLVVPLASVAAGAIGMAMSFASALASVVAYGATSIATAMATAAAWGLANIPMAAMVGILIAIGGMAAGVLMGLASGANDVAKAVGDVMNPAIENAANAFANLQKIGTSVMDVIAQSILNGDLEGAMAVAMEGMKSAFVVGLNGLNDAIKDIPFVRFLGPTKYKFSLLGDSTEGDAAGVKARQEETDRAMEAISATVGRQREKLVKRRQAKDVLTGVQAAASMSDLQPLAEEFTTLRDLGRLTPAESKDIGLAIDVASERITEANSGKPAKENPAAADLSAMVSEDIAGLMSEISAATTLGQLGKAGAKISNLIDSDMLTAEQQQALLDSYSDTQNRIAEADRIKEETGVRSAGPQTVGTFSSMNLGAAFGGMSVAERTAKAAEETARGVKELVNQGGPRAAA